MTEMMDLYGIGDHGGGPTRAILDEGMHWADAACDPKVMPKMEFGTAQTYFSRMRKADRAGESRRGTTSRLPRDTRLPAVEGKVSIPTWKSELYFEYHRGVMTTQANHKRNMRESSIETLNARNT